MKRILTALLVAFSMTTFGQSAQMLQAEGKTFEEICDYMNLKFQNKSYMKGKPNFSRAYMQFKRWEFFWKRSLLPDGGFPTSGVLNQGYLEALDMESYRSVNASNWTYFGPKVLPQSSVPYYPGFGRVNAIAIHPSNHNILIAGAAGSGIWKSTDKGANWSPRTDMLPNVGISDIVYDPNNVNVLYAITGDADGGRNPYSTGMLKSVDGGDNWTIVGLNHNYDDEYVLRRMIVLNSPANTIVATANDGIHKSVDGGVNWTKVSNEHGYCIVKINDQIFYSGTSTGKILKTTNSGNTWVDVTPGNPSFSGRIELGITPNDANFIFALDASGQMAKSNDGGQSWSSVSGPSSFDSQGGYNMTVAVSPGDKNKILIGGIDGWRSLNGGGTWEKYLDGYWVSGNPYFYVHSDHHVMKFVSGGSDTLFIGNDGGVYYGDFTKNTAFVDVTGNMYITQYYGLGGLKTDDKVMVAGAQDNDGVYINGNTVKGLLAGSDGYDGLIDYSNPNISYITTTGASNVEKTTDGWQTTSSITVGAGFYANWDVIVAMHPTNPSTIFFGGNKLVKSTDQGVNWSALYSANGSDLSAFAIAPSNPSVMYLATSTGDLEKTSDNGQNWSKLTNLPISGNTIITSLAVNGTKPDVVYATLSGFDSSKKVFRSTDGGTTWTNITYNLPNVPTSHIVYATGTNDDLYLATDLGVYFNTNGGNSWTEFRTNLPYTQVKELEIHYASNSVFAATYGRGIWKSPLENNTSPTSVRNIELKENSKVFPTLNQGVFTIEMNEKEPLIDYEVIIYNAIGGVVKLQSITDYKTIIDISEFADGNYFVSIKKGQDYFTHQIVKHE